MDRRFSYRRLGQALVGLAALVAMLTFTGLALGLAWGAFQAGAAIALRWLT
jgi:hypothetical protein